MNNLYQEIFQMDSIVIHKGAMLRTFLYKYKISLLDKNVSLSKDDMQLMIVIAKASEQELSRLTARQHKVIQ